MNEADQSTTLIRKGRRPRAVWWLVLLAAIGIGLVWLLLARAPRRASIVTSKTENTGIHQVKVPIMIDTAGQNINAAEIYLKFDAGAVQVQSVSKEGSFFGLWITNQPSFSNTTGNISFAGGIPNPGFKGRGQVGNVTLQAKRAIKTELSYSSTTHVLLNDGLGTAVALNAKPIVVSIP